MKALIYNTWDYNAVPTHEFTITETVHPKTGNPVYRMTRDGKEWTDHYRGTVAIEVEDTGNGYKFSSSSIKKEVGYDEASEIYLMYKFLDLLGKHRREGGGIYDGVIEIIKDSKSITI